MSFDEIKLLLIQIRPDKMKDHEYDLVKKYTGLGSDQIVRLDIFNDDANHAVLDEVDAIVIGGSGDYLISRGDIKEEVDAIASLCREGRKRGMPILGICFGAQILTVAFGGDVHLDEANAETGSYEVTKLDEAIACPIFSELPPQFMAQMGHKDHLGVLPEGAVHLASSERSHHQAFTFPGEKIWAVTFHPELDEEAMKDRMNYYASEYLPAVDAFEEIRKRLRPSPDASRVLKLFLEKIVLNGHHYPQETVEKVGKQAA